MIVEKFEGWFISIMKSNKKALTKKDYYYKIIPLALILLIIPCIVFLKTIKVDGIALYFSSTGEKYRDFFNYYKSVWLIIFTVLSIGFCAIYAKINNIKLTFPKIFIPLLVYYVFVFLSSSFSKYHEQAFWGFNDRFEGFFVISCYVLTCLMAAIFVTYEKDIKILFGALIVCGFFIGIIGIFQYWGADLFQTSFGKRLILPEADHNLMDILDFKFPKQYIYSTLYNPNYVGSFFAMLLPVSIILAVLSKRIPNKILFCIFSCISFINLIGSLSKTGYIAGIIAIVFLIILLNKYFLKAWRTVLVLFISFSVLLIWMNNISGGTILPNVKLFSNITSQFSAKQINAVNLDDSKVQTQPVKLSSLKLESSSNQIKAQNLQLQTSSSTQSLNAQTQELQSSQSQLKPMLIESNAAQSNASSSHTSKPNITDFKIDKNTFKIFMGSNVVNIVFDEQTSTCSFKDNYGNELKVQNITENKIKFLDPRYNLLTIEFNGNYLKVVSHNTTFHIYISPEEKVFKFIDQLGNPTDISIPESIGFKGYEKWASQRGYIWSRSLPLLKDTLFLGHGPDTFAIFFPQTEYNAKLKFFGTPYIMVDKPHNMYIQIAINTGVISLIAFLVFILWFIINSFKLYFKPQCINTYYIAGVSCTTAVVGYLVAGLANDSIIGVSAVFWILLGLGIACNRLYSKSLAVPDVQTQ